MKLITGTVGNFLLSGDCAQKSHSRPEKIPSAPVAGERLQFQVSCVIHISYIFDTIYANLCWQFQKLQIFTNILVLTLLVAVTVTPTLFNELFVSPYMYELDLNVTRACTNKARMYSVKRGLSLSEYDFHTIFIRLFNGSKCGLVRSGTI